MIDPNQRRVSDRIATGLLQRYARLARKTFLEVADTLIDPALAIDADMGEFHVVEHLELIAEMSHMELEDSDSSSSVSDDAPITVAVSADGVTTTGSIPDPRIHPTRWPWGDD